MAELEIRALRPGEEIDLLAAWRRAFAADGRTRTLEEWRWAFGGPAGGLVTVAVHAGEIVAHVAGIRSPTWADGRERGFMQVVDAFALDARSRGLLRGRLFAATAESFFADCARAEEVAYGWPTRAHARLGRVRLGYERLRSELFLAKELGEPRAASDEVRRLEAFDQHATWLWERCASEWSASTRRDARWLGWRFLERPGAGYVVLGLAEAGLPLAGLAVLAPPSIAGPDTWLVVDWLVPAERPDLGARLLAALESEAGLRGARALATMLPPWSPWFERFQEQGWRAWPSAFTLHVRSFRPPFESGLLARSWWITLADCDFV